MYLVSFGVTKALGIGTKCFIEGTLILTSVGLVKIEDIKEGDEVWSYNEETKEKELKKVKRLFRNKTKEWLHLTILNEETKTEEEIICTKNHRIYIKNKGWIEANEILENEEVLLYNNVIGKVIRKELENLTYEETTYNFEVEDNHNYYVGEECVLVHNKCKPEFEVLEFDERAIAMAREGNPSFQTFKNRLFKYQNEIDPTMFHTYKKGLSPIINSPSAGIVASGSTPSSVAT